MPEEEPLACHILRALAEDAAQQADETARSPASATTGMSLPRLGKRLGQSASVLVRELTHLSDATLAGQRGPGWVQVVQEEERWMVYITGEGLAVARELAEGGNSAQAGGTALDQSDIPAGF